MVTALSGCGPQVTFEKVDRHGHVRIESGDGKGYCFKVDKDWEIREKLEGADVVCMAPPGEGFRDSIVARSISAESLKNPEETVRKQLAELDTEVEVLESWSGPDKPVVVTIEKSKFSKFSLGQMLFIHIGEDGNGVLIACTTSKDKLAERRGEFERIVSNAHYDLKDCPGAGGIPEVFPTPNVTLRPT